MIDEISKLGNIKYLINNAGEPSFKLPLEYNKSDINKSFKEFQGIILCSSNVLRVKNAQDLKIKKFMSLVALRVIKRKVYIVLQNEKKKDTQKV